ncbi:MAG: response regulator [Breznakibacter sp.]|jgi:CheY-like chemotaxis protein|nr:response regulator [Breznakibacter sp.]
MTTKYKDLTILIAEDDDGHADLILEGLRDVGVSNEITRFSNGLDVWNFLNNQTFADNNFLLLLDINMPKMDGVEVLKKIKAHDLLKTIPVIMLTTTDDPKEVEACYQYGCNLYITKPIDFMKFAETLRRIGLLIQIVKV